MCRILAPPCTHVSSQLIIIFPFTSPFCTDLSLYPPSAAPALSWTILLLKSPLPEPEQQHCRETHAPRALPLLPRDCYSTVMLRGVAQRSCKGQELLGSNSDGTCSLAILPWKNSALYPNACRESEQAVYPHLKPCNPPFSFPSLHRVATGHLA